MRAHILVRLKQLDRVIGNLSKETPMVAIRFKSLHRAQDVILHQCQGEASF